MSSSQRFAQLALAAFDALGHTTDQLIHEAGGPSSTYMTGLRKAADGEPMKEPRSDTYARIERAAGWRRGSAREVWRGGEPRVNSMSTLEEALAGEPPRQLPGPRRKMYSAGVAGFAERILDRLLDLEERIDAIEQRLPDEEPSRHDDGPRLDRRDRAELDSLEAERDYQVVEQQKAARRGHSAGRGQAAGQDSDAIAPDEPGAETGA